ncbi:hypothetical protein [Streptomyces sp. IB201691-2A2]|uniref:hypothetical protein n=1 Tax=Streptomyces sp. IB201691-2A2 TaxID=2561920 RepID=UPI00117DEADC|nr:hypothetical protein [Streptomyces sp. IB201691-2A2]TRO58547.1 hypothetical protein E4K73_38495 [Streptomyces sp. IB201691-2A2]
MAAPHDVVPPKDALREQLCVRASEALRVYAAVYGIGEREQIPGFVREVVDSMPDAWVHALNAISTDEKHELADQFVRGTCGIHELFQQLQNAPDADTKPSNRILSSTLTMAHVEYPMTQPHRRVFRETLCIKIHGTFRVHDSPVRLAKCNDNSLGERIKNLVMPPASQLHHRTELYVRAGGV